MTICDFQEDGFIATDLENGILYLVKTTDARRFEKHSLVTVWYGKASLRSTSLQPSEPYYGQCTVKKELTAILIQTTPVIPGVDTPDTLPLD